MHKKNRKAFFVFLYFCHNEKLIILFLVLQKFKLQQTPFFIVLKNLVHHFDSFLLVGMLHLKLCCLLPSLPSLNMSPPKSFLLRQHKVKEKLIAEVRFKLILRNSYRLAHVNILLSVTFCTPTTTTNCDYDILARGTQLSLCGMSAPRTAIDE